MALVLWTYNNPRVDRNKLEKQEFLFQGKVIEIFQDTTEDITVDQNTGLKLWDGAFILARHLENTVYFPKGYWSGKKCVELGAGCGLTGIVAWLQGGSVVLTDLQDTLPHTNKCLQRNKEQLMKQGVCLDNEISVKELSWGDDVPQDFVKNDIDIIFGSDIVYHTDTIDLLIKTLQGLMRQDTRLLLSYKKRGLGEEIFFTKLQDKGFVINTIPEKDHPKDFTSSDYQIYHITQGKTSQQ